MIKESEKKALSLELLSLPKDDYQASAEFSENTSYELSTIALHGLKYQVVLKFPFCHFYQIIDRDLFNAFHQIPQLQDFESAICKLETSSLITEVIHRAGGVLAEEDLVHFRICAKNLVIDLVFYKNEESDISIEGVGEE